MKLTVYFALILMYLLTACESKQGKNKLQYELLRLDLHKNLSVSTDSLSVVIGETIVGLAVDSRGNIYLGDQDEAKIHILSPAGRYLGSLGRKGHGPGEFEHLYGIYIYGNRLYVIEVFPNRLSEFRLDNRQLIQTRNFPNIHFRNHPIGIPSMIYPLFSGRYEMIFRNNLVTSPNPLVTFSIVNDNLEPVDTVVRHFSSGHAFLYRDPQNGSFTGFDKNLNLRTLATIGPRGYMYETQADRMQIRVFDSTGARIRNISISYTPSLLTHRDLDSIAEGMHPSLRNMFYKALNQNKISDYWPAMQDLLVDDQGRCWVELVNPGSSQQNWWVFDTDGKPKWKVQLSRHVKLYVIRNHEAYGIWSKQGEYPRIVRYHIEEIKDKGNST